VDDLTAEKLKEYLQYNEDSGCFTWIKSKGTAKKGEVAGCRDDVGKKIYWAIKFNNKKYSAHRLAWFYVHGCWPVDEIDHINGNGCDNRLDNLREVDNAENKKNLRKFASNTTGTTGVYHCKSSGKWYSQITIDRETKHLGYYFDKSQAIKARKTAEKLHGFHANHGTERLF
jgi:hypothetical protein